ncbi:MAG: lyase family protein [Erythrobacter sp.]
MGRFVRRAALAVLALVPAGAQACSPADMRFLFGYETATQTILDVEAAMARAQAVHGVIPEAAARDITEKARASLITQADFDAEYSVVQHRMVALLNVWRRSLDDLGDRYVHFGATTVDIYGTASVLQIDRAAGELDACLGDAIGAMGELATAHKDTPMIGRTLGQHAQPITFGKKVSTWTAEYARHKQRLAQMRARLRKSAILKGPVGNYSGLGSKAIAVEQTFASELGLAQPYAGDWNGTRDVFAEYGLLLGLIAKSHQRIGQEIFLLQGTDIGEVREAQRKGVVGSSSMPHKRNPRAPERLIHAGRTIPRLGEVLGDDVVNIFERDNTSRLAPVMEEITIESVAALRTLTGLLAGLEVDTQAMRANIDRTRGFAMSQRVALALAAEMPRPDADALVKLVIADAIAADMTFRQALLANAQTSAILDAATLDRLLDPTRLEQPALDQIDNVLSESGGTLE